MSLEMTPALGKGVPITLNAYARLPWAAWDCVTPATRDRLEDAARREAGSMTAQGRDMTIAACETLSLKIPVALLKETTTNNQRHGDGDGDDGDGTRDEGRGAAVARRRRLL